MTDEPRAYMRHIRQLRFCARGARDYFARYGLDWSAFLREGVPCSVLEATGDALMRRLANHAREVG